MDDQLKISYTYFAVTTNHKVYLKKEKKCNFNFLDFTFILLKIIAQLLNLYIRMVIWGKWAANFNSFIGPLFFTFIMVD